MSIPVSLRDVVDQLGFIIDGFRTYLHKGTGAIISVSVETLSLVEESNVEPGDNDSEGQEAGEELDELSHAIRIIQTDEYLPFPSAFDVHEWAIMEEFCHSVADGELRARLLESIHGYRAFRRFKDAVQAYRLVEAWYAFREQALKEIARRWLDEHHIAYMDDLSSRKRRG